MAQVDANDLPFGLLRVDGDDRILEANAAAERWAGSGPLVGLPLADILVERGEFLEIADPITHMHVHPGDPRRGALVLRTPSPDGGDLLTLVDASDRLAAGMELRGSHALADRTRTRLELVIAASIDFATATTEVRLAEILSETMERVYAAEEAVVYLRDGDDDPVLVAGANPFDGLAEAATFPGRGMGLRHVVKVSGEAEADAVAPELGRAMRATGVRALLAAPLRLESTTLGAVACLFHHDRQFDQEAAPLADALAGQAAQALWRLRLHQRLEHAATHDETTGLPNRRGLEERTSALGEAHPMAVVFIDLDGFKAVNDRLGHDRGDDVLREVSRRLTAAIREQDIVARYGGDEFIVVCEAATPEAALSIAERLRAAVDAPYDDLPDSITLGASIGVAIGEVYDGVLPIDRLIRAADQAMYAAKSSGGNRVIEAESD